MKKILVLVVMLLLVFSHVSFAKEWDQKSVSDVIEKVKAGKEVNMISKYPPGQTQIVQFGVGGDIWYSIDIRAKLCFVGMAGSNRSAEIGRAHV